MKSVQEPARAVPVVREVDVIVAGAGIAGIFAALGAAKYGARTLLIDRFGSLGGNIGPGMIIGGSLYQEVSRTLHGGKLVGIPAQFVQRVEAMIGAERRSYPETSHAVSRVASAMMAEAGVELILSAYAADPIMDGPRVRGLFVETKSGRVAITAKVVIDATGDADIAARAGAPIIKGSRVDEIESPNVQAFYKQADHLAWNDGGVYFLLGDADIDRFKAFGKEEHALSEDDAAWAQANLGQPGGSWPNAMAPILRGGWESGEFRVWREIRPQLHVLFNNWFEQLRPGLGAGRVHIHGDYDTGDFADVTLMEDEVRNAVYDGVAFLRRHGVPGFEQAFVLAVSPFLGARGGPCIEGEHTLTPQESFAGLRVPDTLFISYIELHRGANERGYDVPYGMLLPKRVEGLLVTGRGAAFLRRGHDPSMRGRPNMMSLGQATGMAAALSVQAGVTPRALDVKQLQRALLKEGFYLGDEGRLAELGLESRT